MERKYEMMYILNPSLAEEKEAELKESILALVNANGTVDKVDDWGRKRLAYEIEKHKEGVYVLVNFTAKAEAPSEIERVMGITEGVLRFLIVKEAE